MTYLISILVSLALFAGFLVLTLFEKKRGLRVAGELRNKLDAKVSRVLFVLSHVDWGAFLKHLVVTGTQRIAHDVAHATLLVVRTVERLLTRAVKYLRERRGAGPLPESGEQLRPLERAVKLLRHSVRNARAVRPPKRTQPSSSTEP